MSILVGESGKRNSGLGLRTSPAGCGFDYINADGLIHMLSAAEGRITTQSAMEYRLLALDPYSQHISLPVLRALHNLVKDGAAVAGQKPTDDPSLADAATKYAFSQESVRGFHISAEALSAPPAASDASKPGLRFADLSLMWITSALPTIRESVGAGHSYAS